MTPSDLLAPQPPAVPGEDKRAVWGLIVDDLFCGGYVGLLSPEQRCTLASLARRRDDFGTAKYGHRLPVDSGRDSRKDELQEALDGMAYSRQTAEVERTAMNAADDTRFEWHAARFRRAWARHLLCLRLVLELLEELGA